MQVCQGTELNLGECKERNLWNHDHHCSHAEDVAISCEGPPDPYDLDLDQNQGADFRDGFDIDTSTVDMLSNEATFSLGGPSQDCGLRRIDMDFGERFDDETNSPIPRIRGGETSSPGEHPWQASIRVQGRDRSYHWCGATIISRFHVVSAAHCLKEFPLEIYLVRVGDFSLGK